MLKRFNWQVQRDPVLVIAFEVHTEKGRVLCKACTSYWCRHIESVTLENRDTEFIWDKPENTEYPEKEIQIPMFPTHDLWTDVRLVPYKNFPTPCYRVDWESVPENSTAFIGSIHPSEGRNIIRNMLIEFMFARRDNSEMFGVSKDCKSTAHSYGAEMKWKANTNPKNKLRTAEYWCVYMNDRCLTCNTDPSFSPDLVPEDKKTGSPW